MCRTRMFLMSGNDYGYRVASLNVPDLGTGWRYSFVRCWTCGAYFEAVWPKGMKVFPCVDCDATIRVH